MSQCVYDPDSKFRRFKLLEFPMSFVGLSTSKELDLEHNASGPCFLRTMYNGALMTFDEAREVSPSHRAFTISFIDKQKLKITFKPTNECISRNIQLHKSYNNRFVFDIRLIKADGFRCCNNINHSEIGRYYVSGQYDYCNVGHSPEVVNFGVVELKDYASRTVRIRNESKKIAMKLAYSKSTGIDVTPSYVLIQPNSSKKLTIRMKPTSLRVGNNVLFHIKNPHDEFTTSTSKDEEPDTNFIQYTISTIARVVPGGEIKIPKVESLRSIWVENPNLTYVGQEAIEHSNRKEIANQFLLYAKSAYVKKTVKEKICGNLRCYVETPKPLDPRKTGLNFCKIIRPRCNAPDLFHISFIPDCIQFGKVGIGTYGEQNFNIHNNTKYDIDIDLLQHRSILYTDNKYDQHSLKVKAKSKVNVTVLCYGHAIGYEKNTFKYLIDKKFERVHTYALEVENPQLSVSETTLKFGMTTSEAFVTSVAVKLYNYFNVPISFEWKVLLADTPFEVMPMSGVVPKHQCVICDVSYTLRAAKAKTYDFILVNRSSVKTIIPLEATLLTRKLSVKFLQGVVTFKDIPLNLEIVERVRLENSSREIATFYVMEPLLPGITATPMAGVLRPKSIITFTIFVKISCCVEFTSELNLKVNNKEIVSLLLTGNVIEPKINVSPKNIFMPRIPCGIVTYVPVNFQNAGVAKSLITILDTQDENIFEVHALSGNEHHIIWEFTLEPGKLKTVFIKVFDTFRREYDLYIPFRVNNILGPPMEPTYSTEFSYYTGEYERLYASNLKVKVKTVNKDINYVRICGVFTVPWVEFSVENFEIDFSPNQDNNIEFTMTNVSKYCLPVYINTAKLWPHFHLETVCDGPSIFGEDFILTVTDNSIKFELERNTSISFNMTFNPQGLGKFIAVALFYLDKAMSIPFYNLTFIGHREFPRLYSKTFRLTFPPCPVGMELSHTFSLEYEDKSQLGAFSCSSKEERNLKVEFIDHKIVEDKNLTIITVKLTVSCVYPYSRNLSLVFMHHYGSTFSVEVMFCFTHCPITLHYLGAGVPIEKYPYPFFPHPNDKEAFEYMTTCIDFLERWLFLQGFRRDLYPKIPYTCHAIAYSIAGPPGGPNKLKGMVISVLHYMKRIAGPFMKHFHKATDPTVEEPFRHIKEICNTYYSLIQLLRSRGAIFTLLQPKFLLSYDQFLFYLQHEPPKYIGDAHFCQLLKEDEDLYNRFTKQCWFNFFLQSYKVFVVDSCFFECVCVSNQSRDIIQILIDWYNVQIKAVYHRLFNKSGKPKIIHNLTSDLTDGVAIISAIYNHCPFIGEQLLLVREVDENDPLGAIVNNACIIMEAMNILRLYFPLTTVDLIRHNHLHMLFLTVHLYVTLPMFRTKSVIRFSPPLLRSSTRTLTINPTTQESLMFNMFILNNHKNCFSVEKVPAADNEKKMLIIVKYEARFMASDNALLLIHGFNKTRVFDTYIMFELVGTISALHPMRKYKLTATIYRPIRVDISVHSPFNVTEKYKLLLSEVEPVIPHTLEQLPKPGFYVKRLILVDDEVMLIGMIESLDLIEHKIYFQMCCLNTQVQTSYLWFISDHGEFFVKIMTQPKWDLPIESQQVKVYSWPMKPCSCGEACECYRSTVIKIPHRNDLMLKALRYILNENASETMMKIYDNLIGSETGQIIILMLLIEGGTNPSEVAHILRSENTYHIFSRSLMPRMDKVTLKQNTDAILALPVTIPPNDASEKFNIMLTSLCGMDVRTYRIFFVGLEDGEE